jgi:cytochrome c2
MNKLIFFLFVVTFIALACTPKASPAVTNATIPTETSVSNDLATIESGHTIFSTKCTRCHNEKPIQKWTYERLRPVLAAMVKKAKLSSTEIGQVSAYVHANAKKQV